MLGLTNINTTSQYYIDAIKKANLNKKSKVLDVGCGIGQYFKYYRGSVTAIDFDDRNLTIANQKYKNIDLIKYDLSLGKFPLKNKFDLVVCFDVIEHLPNDKALKLITDLEKITKGTLLISTPNVNNFTSLTRFIIFKSLDIAGEPNIVEKILYFMINKKLPENDNKIFIMAPKDKYSIKKLHYHYSAFNSAFFKKRRYKVIGGLGFVIENRISNDIIKLGLNKIFYHFPYFSGSILAIKKNN